MLGYSVCALFKQCLVINVMMKKQKCKHFYIFFKNWEEKESEAIPSISQSTVSDHHEIMTKM